MSWYQKLKKTTTGKQRLLLGFIAMLYVASAAGAAYIFMLS